AGQLAAALGGEVRLRHGPHEAPAEVRRESRQESRIQIEDGELRGLVSGSEDGFCVRVLVGGAWGFASSNDLTPPSWHDAIARSVALARATSRHAKVPVRLADAPTLTGHVDWKPKVDPRGVGVEEKVDLLRRMEAQVRTLPEVTNVSTGYSDTLTTKRFVNSDGADLGWSLVRTVAQAHFTAKRGGELAGRSTRVGATKGWEAFSEEDPVEKALEAARSTVAALGAPAAKGGRRTVIIDPELAGVFAHEAVGHASEADLVAAGESCFRGRMGQRLGIEGLTIRDDSTIPGAFGSFPYDDNGVKGRSKPILEDGVLAGFLCDREHAADLGTVPNGAARAQDFHSKPLVRMSNTLIEPGDFPEEELLDGVKDGILCRGSRGGQVDTARGTFLFNAQEAYEVKDGRIGAPLRDVSLTGDILTTLLNIDALGDTQYLGDPGYCGKGQWVPVCDGGPLVRIRDCLVGGSS
ncbi:MAG TPA: TldD/PmbA family protein, partial [Candidatus Thermoplasmatota archaeon]|nr:TldD/PmbA family protein [Candidatus Thermoplasmatota archaeon]